MRDQTATSPEDEDRLNELFGQFVEALSDGREINVEELLGDRPDLITRGRELLSIANDIAVRRPINVPEFCGYELHSEIGRGGMGKVFLARHIELGRTVALKTLPPQWMTGDRAKQRFEREARAVARLKHPNIIPIYDIGEEDGIPYFTMEFVKGRTLATVLDGLREQGQDSHKLTSAHLGRERAGSQNEPYAKRVARFALDLARALEHAHSQGVVHRDVKPSNVLVRPNGSAMLFDFGLATVESETALTVTGEFVGTPHYVSPEQAAGQHPGPLTDEFSLGATLYELLTLERPFTGVTTQDILRQVQDRDPRPPSRLNGAVPRDLETICLTALAKEPNRRYPSMAALADDLERFLESRPILARPVGLLGRAWLLTRRHPAVTLSATFGVLLLVGTPTALFLQARRANSEIQVALSAAEASEKKALAAKEEALQERDIAREFGDALENMIASVNPINGGREARVFELLENVSKEIESLRPEVRAALEKSLATSYLSLTLYPEAEQHLERASSLYADLPVVEDSVLFELRAKRCTLYFRQGNYAAALERLPPLIADYESANLFNEDYLNACNAYGLSLAEMGELAEAEKVLRLGLEKSISEPGGGTSAATFQHNLAQVLAAMGKLEEAVEFAFAAWEWRKNADGEGSPDAVDSLASLAQITKESGDLEAAALLMQRAMELSLEVYGEEDERTFLSVHNLAGLRFDQGDLSDAEQLELQALEMARRFVDEGHPNFGYLYEILGLILSADGRPHEAVEAQRKSLNVRVGAFGDDHPLSIQAHFILGRHLLACEEYAEAEKELLQTREASDRVGMSPHFLASLLLDLRTLYLATGDDEALAEVEQALANLQAAYGE